MTEPRAIDRELVKSRRIADATYQHSRQCKKPLDACKVCQRTVEWFHSLPLPMLAQVLEDRPRTRTAQ